MELQGSPKGSPKSPKSTKVPPRRALLAASENNTENHGFWDPPGPRKLSSRLSKTLIFTVPPYPQKGSKMSSKNLPFGHHRAPNVPRMPKNMVPRIHPKISTKKVCQRHQNNLLNGVSKVVKSQKIIAGGQNGPRGATEGVRGLESLQHPPEKCDF